MCLRYGWHLQSIPHTCSCGNRFTVDHAMTCPKGGFPSIRHNKVRDITANLLTEVCHSVTTEPHLQPVDREVFHHQSANREDNARVDISARGFWSPSQVAIFDVRVFYPNAPSNRSASIPSTYRRHEAEKKRQYGQRIREVERGVFTPLVFSSTGGMARECTTFYQRLASLTAEKTSQPYSSVMGWMRCCLSFALLRMSILCICGTRSSKCSIPVAAAEAQLSLL